MCLPNSRAATLPTQIRPYLLSSFRESIREFFNDLRQQPAPLYKRLVRERVCAGDAIITFNYDMACERELREAGLWEIGDGYGFSVGGSTPGNSRVNVLKLHGSTNWFGFYFGGTLGGSQFSTVFPLRPILFFRPDFEYLGYADEVKDPESRSIEKAPGETALIMPMLNKRFYKQTILGREWESFWRDIWGLAAEALRASDKIVLIGYSMPIADEAARSLLLDESNKDANVAAYCGSRSSSIRDEFSSNNFTTARDTGEGRFEEFLDTGA